MGYVVKLLATAEIIDQSARFSVAPTLIPKDSFLANVNGAMNAVRIETANQFSEFAFAFFVEKLIPDSDTNFAHVAFGFVVVKE